LRLWNEIKQLPIKKVSGSRTFAPTIKERETQRKKALERMKLKEEVRLEEEKKKIERKQVRLRKLSELIQVKI